MPSFDAFEYFADLLVLSLVGVPAYFSVRWPMARRLLLAGGGVYLLSVIAPRLALFYLLFWGFIGLAQTGLALLRDPSARRIAFGCLVGATVMPMVVWKLLPVEFTISFNALSADLVWAISPRLGEIDAVRRIIIPLGLSFATFRGIDLLIQTHLGLVGRLGFDRVLFYGLFPPVLVIGPIIEYAEVEQADERRSWTAEDMAAGVAQIASGFTKVFLLAYPLQSSADVFRYYESASPALVWAGLFVFVWYFYFNFAGYSDVAIGIARLYGFRLKPNFDFPYLRRSPQDFWASWHMSLTRFAQRNIFVPLGGFRRRTQYVAMVATMMTIALWHDLSSSLVLFGLYHATGLVAQRYWASGRGRERSPETPRWVKGVQTAGLFSYVALSFPLLVLPVSRLGGFYRALIGM